MVIVQEMMRMWLEWLMTSVCHKWVVQMFLALSVSLSLSFFFFSLPFSALNVHETFDCLLLIRAVTQRCNMLTHLVTDLVKFKWKEYFHWSPIKAC